MGAWGGGEGLAGAVRLEPFPSLMLLLCVKGGEVLVVAVCELG